MYSKCLSETNLMKTEVNGQSRQLLRLFLAKNQDRVIVDLIYLLSYVRIRPTKLGSPWGIIKTNQWRFNC